MFGERGWGRGGENEAKTCFNITTSLLFLKLHATSLFKHHFYLKYLR